MDDIKKLNSSFFSGSSIQPEITSRIASQENSKRAVEDTQPKLQELDVDIDQQPTQYNPAPMQISTQQPTQYNPAPMQISTQQPTQYNPAPIRIASQENTKRAVQYTKANDTQPESYKKITQTNTPVQIASQENTKRVVQDTKTNNIQPESYKKITQTNTPVQIASQENTKRAVQYTESNQPQQISFSDAVGQAKAAIANLNPNAIKGMNQADAIKYTKNSIADLETKMAQVANLSSMADSSKVQNNPNQAPIVAPNTQVSNNVSNVTNITSDYLRNITASYRTTPQWRDLQG